MSAPLDQLSAALDENLTKRQQQSLRAMYAARRGLPQTVPGPSDLRAHFVASAEVARAAGFHGLASAIAALYNRNFSDWIRERE